MTNTKMTYAMALEIAINDEIENGTHGNEYLEKLEALKESIAKRNSSKSGKKGMTATQKENEKIKVEILEFLETEDRGFSISEMIKGIDCLADASNQKVSALLKQMIDDGKVEKITDKRKVFFKAL